jgi:hypothetical protein
MTVYTISLTPIFYRAKGWEDDEDRPPTPESIEGERDYVRIDLSTIKYRAGRQ